VAEDRLTPRELYSTTVDRAGQTLSGTHGATPMVLHVLSSKLESYEDERGEGAMWRHRCVCLLGSRAGVFAFHEGVYTTLEARGWVRVA
jgi:hypothetical protein